MRLLLCIAACLLAGLTACGGGGSNFTNSSPTQPSPPTTPAPTTPPAPVVQITSTTLPRAATGAAYSTQLQASGGTPPYVWAVSSNSLLPPGFALSSTGTLSGTYPQFGPASGSFNVLVHDSAATPNFTTTTLTLNIFGVMQNGPNEPRVGVDFSPSGAIDASYGLTPITWSVTGTLPPGITLAQDPHAAGDTQQFSFQGIPTQSGKFSFSVTAHDSSSPPVSATVPITFFVQPPLLTLLGGLLQPAVVGQPYSYTFHHSGGGAPLTWSMQASPLGSQKLPPGVTFDSTGAAISGTPTKPGYYAFGLTLSDNAIPAAQQANQGYWLLVTPQVLPQRNDSIATATPIFPGTYNASISPFDDASGTPDQDYYSITVPDGGVLNVGVGQRAANPTNDRQSNFDPVLEILDSTGQRLAACNDPYFDHPPAGSPIVPSAHPGTFTDPCMNHGGDPRQDISYAANLSFKPVGTQTVYLHVFDFRGDARPDLVYTLVADLDTSKVLAIMNSSLPQGVTNNFYQAQFNASGSQGALAWSVSAGALPPGITLTTDGGLSGTPTATGSYTFTVQVSDTVHTVTGQFNITITASPQITSATTLPAGTSGVPYSFTLQAAGGVPPYTWLVVSGGWPLGLDPGSGILSASDIADPGSYNAAVAATDSQGHSSAPTQFSFTIAPGPLYLVPPPSGKVGVLYTGPFYVKGGKSPYTTQFVSGTIPPGLQIGFDSGNVLNLGGTPTTAGTYNVTVRVTDSESPPQVKNLTGTVTISP